MKKECGNCKHCERILANSPDEKDAMVIIVCMKHGCDFKFPYGSTPTCNKWQEKDPTLQELRDEIRELKKQVDKNDRDDCGSDWWHITGSWTGFWNRCDCCDDCCKCKRRCRRYSDWYTAPGTFYYDPYKVTYIGYPYPSTTGTFQISSGNTSDYNGSWTL